MKVKDLIIAIVAISIMGCITMHKDYIYQITIKGKVKDRRENKPLANVKVYFIDVGMDYKRVYKRRIEIGKSNSYGEIDMTFKYWWGREGIFIEKEPKLKILVEVLKEGYKSQKIYFENTDVRIINNRILILLDTIYLDKDE